MYVKRMDFWIPLAGGAVGAAIINSIVGYLRLRAERNDAASRWRKEQERDRDVWTRDQKQSAYSEFLEEIQNFIHHFGRYNNEPGTTAAQVLAASNVVKNHRLLLVASTKVRAAQRELGMTISKTRMALSGEQMEPPRSEVLLILGIELHQTRDHFIAAAQDDLGIPVSEAVPIFEIVDEPGSI